MTTLAIRNGSVLTHHDAERPPVFIERADVWDDAERLAKSGLFPGVTSPEQAYTLMLLCQADGYHPIEAMRRFHLIQIGGRVMPTLKADVTQAEFQASGGRIVVRERSAERAAALFSHPTLQPEPIEMDYTIEDAKLAGDFAKNPNYRTRPKAMLWARLITSAVTTIAPGIKTGVMGTEEAEDLRAESSPTGQLIEERTRTTRAIAASQAPVPGWDGSAPDNRPYHEVVTGAVTAAGQPKENRAAAHRHLAFKAINQGLVEGPMPTSTQPTIKLMTPLYLRDQGWVRRELTEFLAAPENTPDATPVVAETVVQAPPVAAEDASQDGGDPDLDYPEPGSDG